MGSPCLQLILGEHMEELLGTNESSLHLASTAINVACRITICCNRTDVVNIWMIILWIPLGKC